MVTGQAGEEPVWPLLHCLCRPRHPRETSGAVTWRPITRRRHSIGEKAMANDNRIPIFGREDEEPEDQEPEEEDRILFGLFKTTSEIKYGRGDVDADKLKQRLLTLVQRMQGLLDETPEQQGKFQVDSITFTVEISAKGQVSLLGTGGEVGGKGGVTLTLKRPLPPK